MKIENDHTRLGDRYEVAKAALTDMGRPDLAERLVSPLVLLMAGCTAVSWRAPAWPDPDEEILFRRAAALASLSTEYDERGVFCESCIRATNRPDCALVTRTEFLARKSCEAAS